MAGNTGDIVRVALEGVFGAVVFRNVFFYQVTDPPTSGYLTGLLTEFQSQVLTPYAGVLTSTWVFSELVATNLFTGDEIIDVTPTPAAGSRTLSGDPTASFIAAMIVLERQNSRVRNGRKFIPVPMESDTAGSAFVTGTVTLLTALAGGIDNALVPGGVDTFTPCIVGRILYTTNSGRTAYRLPTSQAEMGENFSLVSSARVINRVTTMNSRKYWRGE